MHFSPYSRTVAVVGLSIGVLSGCSEEPAEQPLPSDSHAEEVIDQLEYRKVLGEAALWQKFSLQTSETGEIVNIYNYTKDPFDEASVEASVQYFDRLESQTNNDWRSRTMAIDQNDGSVANIVSYEFHRSAATHDIFLITPETDMPPVFQSLEVNGQEPPAATLYSGSQTVSVITQGADTKPNALFTEICQSMVDVSPVTYPPSLDPVTADQIAQETVCNGQGTAMAFAQHDTSYSTYADGRTENGGTVVFNNQLIHILGYTLGPEEYARLQELL